MTTAVAYNELEIVSGRLTTAEITELVRYFQAARGLTADGKAGPTTQAEIGKLLGPVTPHARDSMAMLLKLSPMPALADGRRAVVTSSFKPPDRPKHVGVDLFYRWRPGDKPDFVGDKGCAGRDGNGNPKWVIPYGTCALAGAEGKVQIAGNSPTGYRLWIDHGNGLRSGYFHLLDLRVAQGDVIAKGTELGLIGDNPADHDGRHLHFELSPVDRYAPIDPAPYLIL